MRLVIVAIEDTRRGPAGRGLIIGVNARGAGVDRRREEEAVGELRFGIPAVQLPAESCRAFQQPAGDALVIVQAERQSLRTQVDVVAAGNDDHARTHQAPVAVYRLVVIRHLLEQHLGSVCVGVEGGLVEEGSCGERVVREPTHEVVAVFLPGALRIEACQRLLILDRLGDDLRAGVVGDVVELVIVAVVVDLKLPVITY